MKKFGEVVLCLLPIWGFILAVAAMIYVDHRNTVGRFQAKLEGRPVQVWVMRDERLKVSEPFSFGFELLKKDGKVMRRSGMCARGKPLIISYQDAWPAEVELYRKFFPA